MNYIIKRIIIGTGIAIALMLLTKTFNLQVYAANNTTSIIPDKLRMVYVSSGTTVTSTEYDIATINMNAYPNTPFYGKNSTGSGIRINQLRWHFTLPSNFKDGYYNISVLFSIAQMTAKEPPTFMFFQDGNFYTGQTRDSFLFDWYQGAYSPGDLTPIGPDLPRFWAVKFDNVYLSRSGNQNAYFLAYFNSPNANGGAGYGITAPSFQLDGNSAIVNNQETIIEQQQEQTEQQERTNDLLQDDDTTDAQSSGSSFFNNFSNTDHGGLSGIITTPLSYIQSLASGTSCEPISLPLPFMQDRASLPCISTTVMTMGGNSISGVGLTFLQTYRIITTGLIAYWVLIKIFSHIRSFKKPDEDRVEVLNL